MRNKRLWKKYECNGSVSADHLFACPVLPIKCKMVDFMTTNDISDKPI